jgi:hypothetical protein
MKARFLLCVSVIAVWLAGLVPTWAAPQEAAFKPGEAKAKMDAARLEIATLRSNIVQTLVQLDKVRNPENRPAALEEFGTQLTRVEAQAQATAERARAMKQKGSAYFAQWEARTAEIQDPAKRQSAESRYTVRKRSYDSIVRNLQEARRNFDPLISSLTQIQRLLEAKPDAGQIAAAKDLFMHANWRCMDVQRSLMEIEAEFTFLAADFAENEK